MYTFPPADEPLQELFDPDLPNSPALWAVLEGKYRGRALVDDRNHPEQCALRTDAALTYFSRGTKQNFLDEAVARFLKAGPVWLVWPVDSSLSAPNAAGARVIERREFRECDPDSRTLLDLRNSLPDSAAIQPIDRALLHNCEWRSEMIHYAGSEESFLEHGAGLCMLQGKEILVEAYVSAVGNNKAEIGALTRKNYRGRGYAPIACAYLIEICRKRGVQAVWSCEADHLASIRVAQKLGFQTQRGYTIYEYESN